MTVETLPESIECIDAQYVHPKKAACYLIVEQDRAAFVDNNTTHAAPLLLEALSRRGLSPEQVDYAMITHVHLDHAGGTAALLDACPNAAVLAHPKAARHVVDPTRLVAGAKAVYGEQAFEALYGEVRPVPRERVRSMGDGEELNWGGRRLRFIHTSGHASHHYCVYDEATESIFTGDAFGLIRNEAARPGPPVQVCSSSPTDFDAAEARKSVDKILGTGAKRAFLAHFGMCSDVVRGAVQLIRSIDQHQQILSEALEKGLRGEELERFCGESVRRAFGEHLRWCGTDAFDADMGWFDADMEINARGLCFLVERTLRKREQQQQQQ